MRNDLKVLSLLAFVATVGLGIQVGLAADPMGTKEASPKLKERIMQDSVKGSVIKIDGEYLMIRDTDGKEVRLHVDQSTKMDKVMPGDQVKAYITDQGHVTTLQRVE